VRKVWVNGVPAVPTLLSSTSTWPPTSGACAEADGAHVTDQLTGTGYGNTETLNITMSGPSGRLVRSPSDTERTSAQLFPSAKSTAGEVTQCLVPFSIR
jgi:hypothetical protein